MVDQATGCGYDDFHSISDSDYRSYRWEEKMCCWISVVVIWWADWLIHVYDELMWSVGVDQRHQYRHRLWNGSMNWRQNGIDRPPSPSITSTLLPSLTHTLPSSLPFFYPPSHPPFLPSSLPPTLPLIIFLTLFDSYHHLTSCLWLVSSSALHRRRQCSLHH